MKQFSTFLLTWRYTRFHSSVLFACAALGLLVGLFVGQYLTVAWHPLWSVMLGLFVAGSFKSRRWYACLLVMLIGLGLGLLRGSTFAQDLQLLDSFSGKQLSIQGTISQDPVLKNGSTIWQAQLGAVRVEHKAYVGEVYATILSDEILRRGDSVTISGKSSEGFGSFQLTMYRAELKHLVRSNDQFLAARDGFSTATRTVVPEPEASLGLGFLVGEKSALPPDLTEQLKTVGLTHIVVASGYNLTIFVRFARKVLARRSRYLAFAGSLTLVACYVFISGFSPSMNRAAVVTFLTLLAWYYGRKFHPVKLILYVASLSAFMYPSYIWSDLGWLLSFAAFTGILVVAPIVTRLLYKKDREPGALMRLILETTAAEVMTLPIIVASFGYVPIFALLANVLVAPVLPFAMFFTLVAGVVGLLIPVLSVLALPASILIAYVVAAVEQLAGFEGARQALQLPLWSFVVWYGLLFVGLGMVWKKSRVDLLASSVIE